MQFSIGTKVVRKAEVDHPKRRVGVVIEHLDNGRLLVSWGGDPSSPYNYDRPKKTKLSPTGLIAVSSQ